LPNAWGAAPRLEPPFLRKTATRRRGKGKDTIVRLNKDRKAPPAFKLLAPRPGGRGEKKREKRRKEERDPPEEVLC